MSNVFARHTRAALPLAAGGDGCYLIDSDGNRYLNCGDAAVSCLGHSDADVINAIQEQVEKIAFAHTGFMTSEPAEALATLLIENAPKDADRAIDRVYFVSGGSEATEAAIKLARQYYLECGEPARSHVIARRQSYHAMDTTAIASDYLAAITPEDLVHQRFTLSPALQLVTSNHPIVSIWEAENAGNVIASNKLSETALITRPEFDVFVHKIDPATHIFISTLANETLGVAFDAGLQINDQFDLAAALKLLLDQHLIIETNKFA